MYDRTGLGTIRTLMITGFKILRTVTEAKFRPFVDALVLTPWMIIRNPVCFEEHHSIVELVMAP